MKKPGTKQTRNKAHPQANAGTRLQTNIARLSARLPGDIAAHLKREEKRCATPTARWKVQWRTWQQWVMLEPQTLQKLLTQSWKHGVSLVQYTWPVKGHKVQFEVDLAKLEVRNMKTNKGYPLQCSGPL